MLFRSVLVYALSRSPWAGGLALLTLGAMMFIVTTGCNTVIQAHVREDMRGRVMAFYSMALVGMQPLGHFAAGAMGERIGTETWLATNSHPALCARSRSPAKNPVGLPSGSSVAFTMKSAPASRAPRSAASWKGLPSRIP